MSSSTTKPTNVTGSTHSADPHSADPHSADLAIAELVSTAGLADPYTRLERIRAMGRAVPSPIGLVITGYDDCQQALRNGDLVSDADATFQPLLGEAWRENASLKLLSESLLFLEGQQHHRVRKLVASAFTPAAVDSWQSTINTIVDELLEQTSQRLKAGESVDLVESLARPLPIAVMAELIGLPRSDAAHLRKLIGTVADLNVGLAIGDEALLQAHEIGLELETYLRTALASEHERSGENNDRKVMGRIALDANEDITIDDRISLAFILLAAGFETTAMLVANAIALLHEHQHEWTQLVLEPDRAARVVEETLRLQTPAAFTGRTARAHTTVADAEVSVGETVTMFLAAANRDPQKFVDPARFNPARYADSSTATAPLSFGSGLHHCLGSLLARNEAIAVLRRLNVLGPVAQIALVEPIVWRPSIALRGVESLVIARRATSPTASVHSSSGNTGSPGSVSAASMRNGSTHTEAQHNQAVMPTDAKARRKASRKMFSSLVSGLIGAKVKTAFAKGDRKQEIKEQFAAETSAKAVEVMGDLKGVTMKMGQMASFMGVGMPEAARRSLSALQANAPAMPAGQAEAAILSALGKSPTELFRVWNPVPVAAASIGQVHRATLHDGREVAVKVQYPGVGDAMAADLDDQARMTKLISRFAMRSLDAESMSRELTASISEELDYVREAEHNAAFAERYRDHPFFRVPSVVPEFSTKTVLTTTWAEGESWNTFLSHATQNEKDRAGEVIFRFVMSASRRYRHFNADPNPGNFLFHPNAEYITFLDFGLAKRVAKQDDAAMWLLVDSLIDESSADDIVKRSIAGKYLREDHGLDPELFKRYLRSSFGLGDFYDHVPFTVTTEWLTRTMKSIFLFEGEFSVIRNKLNSQADYYLRDRVYWGLTGILAELNATNSWKAITNEYRANAPASTPLGELESVWSATHFRPEAD